MRELAAFTVAATFFLLAQTVSAEPGVYLLSVSQYCTVDGIDVRLDWSGQDPQAGSIYIEVGYTGAPSSGDYTAYGPIDANTAATVIQALAPATTYNVRLSQQWPGSARMGLEGTFSTLPACSYDGSYRQPAMPSPGSQLMTPFSRTALASVYAPGPVQAAAYPPVPPAGSDGCPAGDACSGEFTPGRPLASLTAQTPSRPNPNPTCHPSYTGYCVRANVGDWDCGGGTGDGPNYIPEGVEVTIVGPDVFDLDGDGHNPRDNDGIGCNGV